MSSAAHAGRSLARAQIAAATIGVVNSPSLGLHATRAIDLNGSLAAAEKEMRAAGVTLTEMAALA